MRRTGEKTPAKSRQWWLATVILGLAVITGTPLAHAVDALPISAFAGHFRGEVQVQAGDRFFAQQLRNAEVDLRTDADGFRLIWSTVIHDGDGNQTMVRRRDTEMRFVTGPMPNQFQGSEPLEPFTGKPAAWAYIKANTLVVHVLNVPTDGNYELQTYERTLTGDVMTLQFVRISPGRPELVVSGRLERQPE